MELVLVRHGLPLRIDDAGGPADPALSRRRVSAGRARRRAGSRRPASTRSTPARCGGHARRPHRSPPLGHDVVGRRRARGVRRPPPLLHPARGDDAATIRAGTSSIAEWGSPEAEPTRRTFRRAGRRSGRARSSPRTPSQRVALVCHGGVINAYLSHVLGHRPDAVLRARLHEHQPGAGQPRRSAVSWSALNETPHLPTVLRRPGRGLEPSAAGNLAPGELLVDADVAGQAEHPLAEDVLHDLGGAALDRVGPHAQERLLRRSRTPSPCSGRSIA